MSLTLPQTNIELQAALRGVSSLLVVEPNKNDVRSPRKHIVRPVSAWPTESGILATTSLGHAKAQLSITEFDFYTALIKTELTYTLLGDDPITRATGAFLQHRGLLKWNRDGLRITQSGAFSRKDSARTSLAGRFGEAISYLYMKNSGYIYWDHLPALAERLMERLEYSRDDKLRVAKVLSRPSRKDGKCVPEPDFAFENRQQSVALAEAKGAFVNPDEPPTMAKGGLKDGLKQVQLWQQHIVPTPQRFYAIGSYLREERDRYHDPSILAVVDPEKTEEGLKTLEFPDDWIRRGNYAAWMRGMGLRESAELLAYRRSRELPRRTFATLELAGRFYVFTPIHYLLWQPRVHLRRDVEIFDFPFLHGWNQVQVLGMDVNNLQHIEKAVNVPDISLPGEMDIGSASEKVLPDWFSGSILPDGTLHGILHFDNGPPPFSTQEFNL